MKKLMMTLLGVALGCASSLFAEGVINSQSYVSTDLVGQWDAIENNGVGQHSDSITEWKDLTGKTGDFSLRSDIASIEDSAIRKTGKGCMGSIDAEQRKDIRTIEVVVSEVPIDGGYWIPTVFVTKDQNISIFDSTSKSYPGRRFFLDYSTQKTTPVEIPIDIATVVGLYRDATTATNCYQNGEILGPLNPASGSDHWAQDHGWISLCGIYGADKGDEYNGNKVFGHRIHAIRFYTRELTPAEITRNAFIDSIRFASNDVAEVSRCFLTDDGKAMVSVKVDIEKAQHCELSATIRDLSTGTTTEPVLGTAADSNTHDYEITGLAIGHRYEVVIHGTWVFSTEQKVKMALRSFPVCVCDSLRYVQNGLVGQWDAIENAGIGLHSNGIASWSDLTGSTGDFELDVNIAEIGEQDIFKKGQGCLGSIDAPRRTDVKTIEAVISETPYNTWVNTVFISKTQHVSVTAGSSSRTFFYDDNRKIASADTMPVPATVVGLYSDNATVTNGYQNGVNLGGVKTGTAYWSSDSTRISLCGTFGADNTSGANSRTGYKIHAVRFYTRELTSDEIKRHAFIDQLRFSPGGLATAKWSVTGDSKVKVYGTVNTLGGTAECTLSAICREGGTGVTTTNELGTVSSSEGTYEYIVDGLDASKQYDIVLHGIWTMNADNSVTFASDIRAEESKLTGAQKYVQDGLVGQWDAIENAGIGQHSDSITEWVDLTGDTGNFTLDSNVATVEDSAILKTASGVMGTIKNTPRPTGVRTIEAVVSELPSSGWVAAVLITPNQTVTMTKSYNGSPAAFFDDQHYGKIGFGLTTLMTFTGLYASDTLATNSYQNGGLMTGKDYSTHWSKDPGKISMGGVDGIPNSTNPNGYRIHAIRFYTRELTPAEIARNAFLDQLRFTGNGIAEVSRTVVGANGEMRVAVAVTTPDRSSPCTLTALVRDCVTGEMKEVPLANSVSDSASHEYTISGLDPSRNYEIVIRGSWCDGELQYDLKTFDVSPEVDALPGTVYQVAASASATNAFDWVVAGSGLRRPPKTGDTVYVGLTNGTYQLLLSGAESKLIDLRFFAGAGMVGVTPKVTVQEGAVVSTRDGFAVGAATAGMTATGELLVSGGSLTAGGQGIVCAGGNQLVQVSSGTLSASKLSILDADSVAKFRIIGSDADVTVDAADPSVAPKKGTRKNTPVFWDYRFDTTAVPGGPGVAPRKMSASDATVHGHFRLIPYGGFQLASTNVFPLVVHTGGEDLVEGTAEGAKYDPLCTDLWSYTRNGSVLSAELNPNCEMTNGVSRTEGLVRGYLKLPPVANPSNCISATVRMKVEPADPEKKSLGDIVAAIDEQYPGTREINKGGYNVEVPLRLDRLAKGESNKVVFDFSEFSRIVDIESGTVTTNAVVKAIAAEIKKPGIVLIVR